MAVVERHWRKRVGQSDLVTWRARWRDPDGRQRAKTFARKADAERFLNVIESSKLTGAYVDPAAGRLRFGDWVDRWWATGANLRPSTRLRDATYLRLYVLPRFGTVPLAAIGQPDAQAWVASLSARGLSAATVVKAYQLLGKVLGGAVDAGLLAQTPCRRVRLPRVERHEARFLSALEVAALADAIAPRYRTLVLLGAYGGLRIGELAGLRRRDCDLLRGTVEIVENVVEVSGELIVNPPKTRAGRRKVSVPRAVVRELGLHLETYVAPSAGARLFTSPDGGLLSRTRFRSRVWDPAVRSAGIAPLRIHDLRHTAGRALDRGRREPNGTRCPCGPHQRLGRLGPIRPPLSGR